MKTLSLIFIALFFLSCKKEFTCVCETTKTTAEIYYLNKVETEKTTVKTGSTAEPMKATEKKAEKNCSSKNSSYSESNNSLPAGRSGGDYTYETSCKIL